MIGAKLTPFFYGKFTLINKARSRLKVFEPFEDSSKNSSMVNAILISYCYISLMILPPPQVIFGLLLLSIAAVIIWDIRYNPFGEDEDGI